MNFRILESDQIAIMRFFVWILVFCLCGFPAAAQDYRLYHELINRAEVCFFIKNNPDSAFYYYDKAFATFDFVFASDCFMSAQMAYSRMNLKYVSYLNKGFQNGVRREDLSLSKAFTPLTKPVSFSATFPAYISLRKKYLKRIRAGLLKRMTREVSADRAEKNFDMAVYAPIINKRIASFETLAKANGFPGDKLIGLSEMNIMSELGFDSADYKVPFDESYYTALSQTQIFPMLVHHECTYTWLKSYWEGWIKRGEIHPREVALLYDNILRLYDSPTFSESKGRRIAEAFVCDYGRPFGGYNINLFVSWPNLHIPRSVVDSMRARLYINPVSVDSIKKEYAEKQGWKTTFGFWDCR